MFLSVTSSHNFVQMMCNSFGRGFGEDLNPHSQSVAYPGIFFGGVSRNSVEGRGQREQGSGGSSPLVRGSGGSCNFVQGISFHIVKFSQFFGNLDYL